MSRTTTGTSLGSDPTRPLRGQDLQNFLSFGEPSGAELGEDQLAVPAHLEGAAAPFDQLDVDIAVVFTELVRQTGGSWSVASNDAIFDADVH
jgi:hypothetical protein